MAGTDSGTVRLYREDPSLATFTAKVLEVRELEEESWAIVIDRTAFYPEGGGQPADEGRLGEAEVFDVQEEEGVIVHYADCPLEVGEEVEGSIDWERRWDIMQQHTGQHLLSGVLLDDFDAATRGFHMGAEESTIDLSRELGPQDLSLAQARANVLVDADLPVTSRVVDREDPAVKAARRPPPGVDEVRLVEIEGVDSVPCGGTHVPSTSRIGGIHILAGGSSKAHGLFRISFLCGTRLRRRLGRLDRLVTELSHMLTTNPDDFRERFEDFQEQNKDLKSEVTELRRALVPLRTEALLETAESIGPGRVVLARVDDLPPETLPAIASALTEHSDVVALLGAEVAGAGRLIFARGEGLDLDMGTLLSSAAAILGGGGGGAPHHASGGGPQGEALDAALTTVLEQVRSLLKEGA